MWWAISFFLVMLGEAGLGASAALAEEKSPALLEQQYDREPNARKRARLAIELTRGRLTQLRAAYDAEDSEPREKAVEAYRAALERLETAVTAAAHAGTSKTAEMHLRRQGRDLENFKTNVTYLDRPAVEKLIAHVAALREQILYSLMNPNQRKAKQ